MAPQASHDATGLRGSMRQSHTLHIDRPVDVVFAYTEDPDNAPKWAEGIVRFDLLDGDRPGPGSRYEMVIKEGRSENRYEGEVTAWVENERTQNVLHRDGMRMTMDRVYEAKDGGTEVTMTVSLTLPGAFKLMAPLVWLMNRRFLKKQSKALKHYVEAET